MIYYFRYLMSSMFNYNWAPLICLTNCGDEVGWANLGISNIEENSWYTNKHYNQMPVAPTINRILAEYPDGSYNIDVTCYTHTNDPIPNPPDPDPAFSFDASIPCELHNFAPALQSVLITGLETDQTYYDGVWVPNGTSAELAVSGAPAPAGAQLQVILIFTEEMNTSQGISVILGPLSVGNGEWSSSVVTNDTWTGEVTLPAVEVDGSYILSVSASDTDGLALMDPEGAGTVPGPSFDTHHNLSLIFETELEWTVSVNDQVLGSPKLADIDLDGDLDVIIQSADGYVDVLDDDGTSMWGGGVDGHWSSGDPDVWTSPAIINLTGVSSSAPEILAVHPSGCNGFTNTGIAITPWTGIFIGEYTRFFALSSPVTGDFNGDDNNEFVMGRETLLDPLIPFPMTFFGKYNNGNSFWSTQWGNDASVSATATLCDVDGIGGLEVLAVTNLHKYEADNDCTLYCLNASDGELQWSTDLDGSQIFGALATGNLDADPAMEIVVGASQGSNFINVFDGVAGAPEYSKLVNGGVLAGASIADIDGNGNNDIVVSSSGGMLYCWDGSSGDDLSGFPVNLGTWTDDGISIGDIDSDGMLELVIAGKDGKLYVINHDGSHASGFPVTVSSVNGLSGQPALGDIDNDGRLEIIFGELDNSVLHCYEMGDNSAFTYLPWPQFQHDAANTGYFPTDITAPGAPSSLSETHTWVGDIVIAYLSWTLSPDDPGDVIGYRIYGHTPPDSPQMMAFVPASSTSGTVRLRVAGFYNVARFYVTAYDGVNESSASNDVRIRKPGLNNLAQGCPVREILHSAAIGSSGTSAAIGTSSQNASIGTRSSNSSAIAVVESRTNCEILTDGYYDAIYTLSSSSDCIEIDLGAVFTVNDIVVIRSDQSLTESHRYELSVDGRSFRSTDTGRARYVRVYNTSGASEIEVIGTTGEGNSALIDIQRGVSGGYRIASVEAGSPLTVSVFDLSGRKVWSSTSSTGEILWNRCSSSGSIVPAGVYLIMVESDNTATFTAKVVVR
ncbi:MAG: VCBS repeat-containing protein [Candidatus Sabulitectum sp.]|nr:VCBS repeat-containing protein [Candidatus Sabulitectum sp.]